MKIGITLIMFGIVTFLCAMMVKVLEQVERLIGDSPTTTLFLIPGSLILLGGFACALAWILK